MNDNLRFWIPAGIRLVLLAVMTAVLWYFFGPTVGLALGIAAVSAFILLQLRYLQLLSQWLEAPESFRLPDGWGAWSEVFARLYRLRREDERHQAELAEWLARFRQAMQQLPDGVAILDDVLFLEWCNPVAEQHLGLELARDKGMRITNVVRSPRFIDYLILGRHDTPLTLEVQDRRFLLHVIPFENRRQIVVTHDITHIDRLDRMRRDFIANASHELRTPLTVINGFLEIACTDTDLPEDVRRRHLLLMSEQGQRMQDLVEDMLSLTRLESTDDVLHAEPVPMQALLQQVLSDAIALSGGRHEIKLTADGPDLRGSGEDIRSAFLNLASNAVRYTPDGGRIDLRWTDSDAGPAFSVRDTGIGIAPEHLPRLMERFYRVDKGRSRATRGTGLGLAIVKHVMTRHGGTLDVQSVPQKGSIFTACFPDSAVFHPD